MNNQVLRAFGSELTKISKSPNPSKDTVGPTTLATDGRRYEVMTAPKWRQTLKDVPVSIVAMGLGYGIGKTVTEAVGERVARKAQQTGQVPGWVGKVPVATAVLSGAAAYGTAQWREHLKDRRNAAQVRANRLTHRKAMAASKVAGIPPAPQSRNATKRNPNDPWRYDPRNAGLI